MISDDNPVDDASVPPTPDSAIRAPNFKSAGQAIGDGLGASNWLKPIFPSLQDFIIDTVSRGITFLLNLFVNIIGFFGQILVRSRDNMDEGMAKLASEGLSDLFGQDLETAAFAQIGDNASRKQIANVLGNQILRGIVGDISTPGAAGAAPSDAAAKAFLTRMAELTVEGWFESIITGIVSEHPFEKIGDLKEQVGRTFGFGRISHRILAPAIDAVVATPFKWKVEKDYRTKLLGEGTAVEMFLRGNLSRDELNEELARQGYADSRIDKLIAERQRVLPLAAVVERWLSGAWTYDQATAYLGQQGYSQDVATLELEHAKQARLIAVRVQAMDAARRAYITRFIDVTEFTKYVTVAVIDPDIQHEIITQASAERELNRSRVTEGKAEEAVLLGFWNIQDYTDHLQKLGYNDDDIITMQLLTQDRIAQQADKLQARKDAAAARAATKAAALLKAQQRQVALDQQRTHRALSLAQVHRGYVQGRLTLPQLQAFLVGEKQDPADIQTLLDLAQAERADYQLAQTKKARANEKLAVTTLSTAQLEHLVKNEQIAMLDYQTILEKEGVPEDDVTLLIKAATVDLQAAQEAKAHRAAVAAKTAEKGLSLAQMESAVRQGLRSTADFTKWLTDNHYGPPDIASLTGLLQDRIAADKLAEQKKEATAAKLAHKPISLAAMELAVRKGLRPIADYQQELIDEGVNVHDVATLTGLLQAKIADDAAAAKRKAAAAVKAATKGITLADIERAARLGIVTEAYYRQALVKAGLPPEDQDVMIGLLHDDQAKVQLARTKQAEAEAKLKNKPATLANLKHGVMFGIRTIADYRAALQESGFDADAVDLMAELAQDEIAQAKVSVDRKAALDAQRTTREISRADFEKAVVDGFKTFDDYRAFLVELKYDEEDQGILSDLLAKKMGVA